MLPYLIAGAIGFVVAKLFEEDEALKYSNGGQVDMLKSLFIKNGFTQDDLQRILEENSNYFNQIEFYNNETIIVYRTISLPRRLADKFIALDKKEIGEGIGEYWTLDKEFGSAVWGGGHYEGEETFDITCVGHLKIKDIDWEIMKYAFKDDGWHFGSESEIRGVNGGNCIKVIECSEIYSNGGLIAPNGKPSNLNPEQYKLVRTPAFKKWFGDWENDPANASKVVDENGEPLVVYHGTKEIWWNDYFVFNPQYEGKSTNITRRKFGSTYFTSKKKVAQTFGNIVIPAFLNFKNPIVFDANYQDIYWMDSKLEETKYEDDIIIKNTYDYRASNVELDSDMSSDIFMVTQLFNKIKLADGSNTTFDGSNPDVRFEDGGRIIAELQNYIKDIEVVDDEDGIMYYGTFGNDGSLTWIVTGEFITVNTIDSGNKKGGEGTMAIANLFLLNPKVKTITYQDHSHFQDGTSFWVRIGGDDIYLDRSNFFKYFEKKFGNNPDIRYAGGGELKKTYQDLIEGYELSLEIESDEEKIKMYNDLIEGYKLALELEEEEVENKNFLAPNGKPSNLNPEQYKLVREPAFKQWFGDWENDKKNSSEVLDENGEPLVVYHFSDKKFNVFDLQGVSEGFFFTEHRYDNEFSYEGIVKALDSENYPQWLKEYIEVTGYSHNKIKKILKEEMKYKKAKSYFLNIKKMFPANRVAKFTRQEWSIPIIENRYIREAKIEGYNGVVFVRKTDKKRIIVAFEPNQIKLADGTNTTFDGNNPDIRFDGGGDVNNKALMVNDFLNEQKELQRNSKYAILLDATWNNYTDEMRDVTDDLKNELIIKLGYNPLYNYAPFSNKDSEILMFDDDSNLLGLLEFTIEPKYTIVPRFSPSDIKPEKVFENNNNVFYIEYIFSFGKGKGQKMMNQIKKYANKYNVAIGLEGSVVEKSVGKYMASAKHLERFYDKQGFVNTDGNYYLYSPNSEL